MKIMSFSVSMKYKAVKRIAANRYFIELLFSLSMKYPAPRTGMILNKIPSTKITNDATAETSSRSNPSVMLMKKNRSEEHTSELQSPLNIVCRLRLEKQKCKTLGTSPRGAAGRAGRGGKELENK